MKQRSGSFGSLMKSVLWVIAGLGAVFPAGAQPFTNAIPSFTNVVLFGGTIALDGDISDFFETNGLTPKAGVCLVNDPMGLDESPLEGTLNGNPPATKTGQRHPSGFNQRRIMTAYRTDLNGGTIYIGIDLPGGTGANSMDKTNHAAAGNANPNYDDGTVGGSHPPFGRGKILPFDSDANGEADTIGRKLNGDLLFRCLNARAGDSVDIVTCSGPSAGLTDNPRTASGETLGARENYVAHVAFGNGVAVTIELFQDGNTPAGAAQLRVLAKSSPPAPFGVAANLTNTTNAVINGGTVVFGAVAGFDVEFAITNVNNAVPDVLARLRQQLIVDSGSNRDGASQGEDQNAVNCSYALPTGLVVIKNCPATNVPPGGTFIFTGTVINTSQTSLTNVVVFNDQPAPDTLVFGPTNLGPGESLVFTNAYVILASYSACTITDTLIARATNAGVVFAATNSATCPVLLTPRIEITQFCPATNTPPGGTLIVTATVCNRGNVTLTNISVANTLLGLTTNFIVASLATNECFSFTNRLTVPTNVDACFVSNIVTASATTLCGSNVMEMAMTTCPILTTPRLAISGFCPATNVPPGGVFVFTGAVCNVGDITLTNVTVDMVAPVFGLGRLLGPLTLPPGVCTNFMTTYPVPVNYGACAITNTVMATGTSLCGSNITTNASTICPLEMRAPILTVMKFCPETNVPPRCLLVFSGYVSNGGCCPLTNVIVVNDKPQPDTRVFFTSFLSPGEVVFFTNSYSTPDTPGPYTDTLTALGFDQCTGSNVMSQFTASCPSTTNFQALLEVSKDIACVLARQVTPGGITNDVCGEFGEIALGLRCDAQLPAFCYRITVSNSGPSQLTNITVVDDKLLDISTNFPSALGPGEAVTVFFKMAWGVDTTNAVTATARSPGQSITARDSAVALVDIAMIACRKIVTSPDDLDGVPDDNHVTLPNDGNAHLVRFAVEISNPGGVDLLNVTIHDPMLAALGCSNLFEPFDLHAFTQVTVPLCDSLVRCPGFTNQLIVTAQVDPLSTDACIYDITNDLIRAQSQCQAVVACAAPLRAVQAAILGQQSKTATFPSVLMATYSGQVIAPLDVQEAFEPNSPCIQGRWEHVRYGKGTKSTFTARTFDGFMAMSMDPLESHPAPPNAACFSGLGDYRLNTGNKAPRTVIYRVDIEDHGEPGLTGSPDRYRIRLWILTPRELARLANPSDQLLNFRRAIAATESSMMGQGGSVRLGAAAFGVRPADVDDGGLLDSGNTLIQPISRNCH